MLVSQEVPALYGGVSQQTAAVRAREQLTDLQNGWASLADGVSKRAPTETVAKLLTDNPTNVYIHEINRDVVERYIVIAQPGSIRVFDLDGNERPVYAPRGWSYFDGITDYTQDLTMTTVADYTFVTNRKRVCAMAAIGADTQQQNVDNLWLNRQYGTDPNGLPIGPGLPYQYDVSQTTDYLTGTVQQFSKLPATAGQGELYHVTGDDTSGFTSYYVRYNAGVWDETVAPGLVNGIDETTMPHGLVRQADGSFMFAPFSWAPRRVGDESSNPNPRFIGRAIRSVLFYQNRLVFLNGENATMSAAGDFGNFYRMTVLDLLDGDPIDVAATTTRVSNLYEAVPFNDGILLTSDQTQFSLTNGQYGISSSSVAIRPVTNYEVAYDAGMAAIGTEVYFASERNGWASLREYTRDPNVDAVSAAEITAHVPRLIPAGVRRLIPAGDMNALFTLTRGDPGALYVYQFYWASSTEKAQSAHHRWSLGSGVTILAGVYLTGFLYLCVTRSDGVYLERINLVSGAKPDSAPIQVYLDRRHEVTGTYNVSTQQTLFMLPYAPDQAAFQVVRGSAFSRPGALIDPTSYVWIAPNAVAVPGDETAGPVTLGQTYPFRIEFSPVFFRKYYNGEPVTSGRMQLRTWKVFYRNAGYFQTEVRPYADTQVIEGEVIPSKVAEFTGKVLGSRDLILNAPVLHSSSYTFTVYGDARLAKIAINNDSHVGATFVSAAFEGFYWNRSQAT